MPRNIARQILNIIRPPPQIASELSGCTDYVQNIEWGLSHSNIYKGTSKYARFHSTEPDGMDRTTHNQDLLYLIDKR